jgi:hypothetical protein
MKKIMLSLNIVLLLSCLSSREAAAQDINQFNFSLANLSAASFISSILSREASGSLLIKKGAYAESDDPLMRRGTQNTDSPQVMFLVIPFLLTAVFFIVLFVRKK